MDLSSDRSPSEFRKAGLYLLFVGRNPSLKEYMVISRYMDYHTHEQLCTMTRSILGKRSELRINLRVLAEVTQKMTNVN